MSTRTERNEVVPLAVSVADAAKMLGVSEQHLYRLIRKGTLRAVQIGQRRWVIPMIVINEIVEHGLGDPS